MVVVLAIVSLFAALALIFFAVSHSKRPVVSSRPVAIKHEQVVNSTPRPAASSTPRLDPLATGPLLKSAPANSKWVVTFSYPDGARAAARIKQITTTRTLPLTYEEIIDEAGNKTEKWYAKEHRAHTAVAREKTILPAAWRSPADRPVSRGLASLAWEQADQPENCGCKEEGFDMGGHRFRFFCSSG